MKLAGGRTPVCINQIGFVMIRFCGLYAVLLAHVGREVLWAASDGSEQNASGLSATAHKSFIVDFLLIPVAGR
jgi:hypothetical protein